MAHAWKNPATLRPLTKVVLWVCCFGGPLVIGVIQVCLATTEMPPEWKPRFLWVTVFVAVLTVCAFVVDAWSRRRASPHKPYIDSILEELGREVWVKSPTKLRTPLQEHRITLFQLRPRNVIARRIRPKWTHKLVPRTRWTHGGPQAKHVWLASDRHNEYNQGVAGMVFGQGSLATGPLPDIRRPDATEADFKRYAELTNDHLKNVRKERYQSQIIAGVTIYNREYVRWGVLIFDSTDPDAITAKGLNGKPMRLLVGVLSKALERGQP